MGSLHSMPGHTYILAKTYRSTVLTQQLGTLGIITAGSIFYERAFQFFLEEM